MPRLPGRRSPIIVKAVAVAHRRGDQCIDIDVLDACDAHVDIGATQHVWRVNAIVDVDAALRAEEMVRDRIAAAIVLSLARRRESLSFPCVQARTETSRNNCNCI
jgi:hypothetical protein